MRRDFDLVNVFDPVAEVINKQLGSIWKSELLQRDRVPNSWKYSHIKESQSTPYSYEDELNNAIDLKYDGRFKIILTYQYLYMGYGVTEVAKKVGVHRRTVSNWIKMFRDDQDLREILVKMIRGET